MFQLGLPACLEACQLFKHFFLRNATWKFLYFIIIKKFHIILDIINVMHMTVSGQLPPAENCPPVSVKV